MMRRFTVSVRGQKSNQKFINRGVPQGSCLGPLLFCLYINDLLCDLEAFDPSNMIVAYADDLTIVCSDLSLEGLFKKITNCLKVVTKWADINHMSLNWGRSHITSSHFSDFWT